MSDAPYPPSADLFGRGSTSTEGEAVRVGATGQLLAFGIEVWSNSVPSTPIDFRTPPETLTMLRRILDNYATLTLRCAALEAEKVYVDRSQAKELRDALNRIQELEGTLGELMAVVARYEDLLHDSEALLHQADQRTARAEGRVHEAEHSAAEAVDWLYRSMAVPLLTESGLPPIQGWQRSRE